MKKRLTVLLAVGLCMISLCLTDLALARSQTLSTTIVVNVIAVPKTDLAANDNNAEIVNELAATQAMSQPHIRVTPKAAQALGNQIYTITDRL